MRLRRRVRFLVPATSTEKEKSRTLPARYFSGAYRVAVYCEFGDFSPDFVRPCQLDQSLNPNRKQVREFAPPYKASDTEAAREEENGNFAFGEYTLACRLRASSTRSVRRMRTQRIRTLCYAPGEIPRTGSPDPKKRKSTTFVVLCTGITLALQASHREGRG